MTWRNRPTNKEHWPDDIDYIMFIDENGDSSLKNILKRLKNNEKVEDNNKYFTTTGCIMKRDDFPNHRKNILNLKNTYWENGLYLYGEKEKRVCFHSNEIRKRKEAFSRDIINYEDFIISLSEYMGELKITVLAASLDKEKLCRRYAKPYDPYDLCMNFILERFVKFYLKDNEKALIILEARGKDEDKKLLEHIKKLIDNGTDYVCNKEFKKIKGVYFNPKWCKEADSKKSYFGLEIADLVSYPIHKFCTRDNKDMAFNVIENKINKYPNYIGCGIKKFP